MRLRTLGDALLARHLDGEIGRRRAVLAETGTTGRTEQFTPVRLAAEASPGTLIDVQIAGHDGRRLLAA